MGWTFVKILDNTKVGCYPEWRIVVVEADSGGWEQGNQLKGPQLAVEKNCQKHEEVQKKQMQSPASRV